jgi:hypothetical protein
MQGLARGLAAVLVLGAAGIHASCGGEGAEVFHSAGSPLDGDGGDGGQEPPDAGSPNAGPTDGGQPDGGPLDAGRPDAGASSLVMFFQLDVTLDTDSVPDSDWGEVHVTHEGAAQLLYFNLAVNGSWQVRNAPLLSAEGTGATQTEVFSFDLGVPPGVDVTQLTYAATIEPTLREEMPDGGTVAPVLSRAYFIAAGITDDEPWLVPPARPFISFFQDGQSVKHEGFPNQQSRPSECVPTAVSNSLQWLKTKHGLNIADDELTIDKMKAAVGWHGPLAGKEAGTDQGWEKLKDKYMKAKGFPISTKKVNPADFRAVHKALTDNCDVELTTRKHAVAVIGMQGCDPKKDPTSKTKCELTVAHDSDQTNNNAGTIEERVTYKPTSGQFDNGGPWTAEPVREFVIECPEKKKKE